MRASWLGWRDRAIAALAKLANDKRVWEELREKAAETARFLALLNSRFKMPRDRMLVATARVALLAAKAALQGAADAALAIAPEPQEIDDLARGFERDPLVSFAAWKAKVVAAIVRAVASRPGPETKQALVELAEEVVDFWKPRGARSWKAQGVHRLLELADLVKSAAEETGSAELASLVPTADDLRLWLGGNLPPPPKWLLPPPEKPRLTPEALMEWLARRLSIERGNVARIPVGELRSEFTMMMKGVKDVEALLMRKRVISAGNGRWRFKGSVFLPSPKGRERIFLVFKRVREPWKEGAPAARG